MATKNYVDLDMPIRGRCRKWERKAVCLKLDGTDDDVNCGNDESLDLAGSDATWEIWLNPSGEATGARPCIFNKSATYDEYSITKENSALRLYFTNAPDVVIDGDYFDPGNNIWYHIVITLEGNTVRFYRNSSLVHGPETDSDYYIRSNDANLYLGLNNKRDAYLGGLFDEVRIYARAISEDEIKWNYMHRFRPYSTEGLVLWLPMNECVGKWAFDKSNKGNDGELFGPVWRDEVTITDL